MDNNTQATLIYVEIKYNPFWFVFPIKIVERKMLSKEQWKFPSRQKASLLYQSEINCGKLKSLSREGLRQTAACLQQRKDVATTEPLQWECRKRRRES